MRWCTIFLSQTKNYLLYLRDKARGLAQRGRKHAGGPVNGSYLDKRRLIPRSREYGCKEAKREARPCRKVLKRLHKTQEASRVSPISQAPPLARSQGTCAGLALPRRGAEQILCREPSLRSSQAPGR